MALNITRQQLEVANSYADAGDYKAGWDYLASVGDKYADNAYVVTSGNTRNVYDEVMNRMVKNYWDKVAKKTGSVLTFKHSPR